MYAHHIIGAITFYQTLFFMDFMVVFGVMLLFQEVSTTYVSMRWLLHKHKLNNTSAYNINQLVTFVTFLVFRLIYQIYITFFLAMDWIVKEIQNKNMETFQIVCVIEMTLMVTLSIILNLYWMHLMCKMAQRTMSRMNTPEQEGQPKANVEKVELIDQNAIKSDDIPVEKKKA